MGLLDEEEDNLAIPDLAEQGDMGLMQAPVAPAVIQPRPPMTAPASPDDALRNYFGSRLQTGEPSITEKLNEARNVANESKNKTRMLEAAANLSHALSRSNVPVNNKPFDEIADQADQPVKDLATTTALQTNQDKILRDYFSKQQGLQLQGEALKQRGKHGEDQLKEYGKRTDVMGKNAEGRLALAGEGLNLRKGNQAVKAADVMTKDKVMMTTSQQGQQLDKALGRINDVMSGKMPFTTTIKADIEKDLANVISGGTSSSLGQLDRVEFSPYAAKWQAALDKIHGYQGSIDSPEYVKQLKALLGGLQSDIGQIRAKRSKYLADSYGTAFSGNELATKTLNNNVDLNAVKPEAPAAPPAGKVRVINKAGQSGFIDQDKLEKALASGNYTKG